MSNQCVGMLMRVFSRGYQPSDKPLSASESLCWKGNACGRDTVNPPYLLTLEISTLGGTASCATLRVLVVVHPPGASVLECVVLRSRIFHVRRASGPVRRRNGRFFIKILYYWPIYAPPKANLASSSFLLSSLLCLLREWCLRSTEAEHPSTTQRRVGHNPQT